MAPRTHSCFFPPSQGRTPFQPGRGVGGRSLSSPSKVTRQFGTSTTLRNWAGEAEPLRGVPGGTRMTKTADLGRCCRRRNGPVRFSAGWLPGRCPARVSHPFRRLVASVGEAHVPWANSSTGGRNQAWTISAHHVNQRRPLLRLLHRRHLSLCFLGSSFPDCGEQRQARSEGNGGLADQRNRRRTPTQSLVPLPPSALTAVAGRTAQSPGMGGRSESGYPLALCHRQSAPRPPGAGLVAASKLANLLRRRRAAPKHASVEWQKVVECRRATSRTVFR
jgi:hypothetical protein